jgi:phenylacetate-CoA ligase
MSNVLLKVYQCMPQRLRPLAATMRGFYLDRWRYGPDTERLVEEAFAREHWSSQAWKTWQDDRLAFVLHRAATRVPFYRDLWAARRRSGHAASWECLENWPILDKETVRRQPERFVADDCDRRDMFHERTSGTTGTPLNVWWSRQTVRSFYALFEARWRRWYGVSRADRWAILGGQVIIPGTVRRPPFWVWNAAMRQLYMSCYHLSPDLVPHYAKALVRYRVKYLWGYTGALHTLAESLLRQNCRDIKLEVVVTNAEPLGEYRRAVISEAFQCPVRETYGLAEIVTAGGECECDRLHVWTEVGLPEILERGVRVLPGASGELVSTSLLNADMPLIRYRTGDRAALAEEGTVCRCGRSLPLFKSIDGRSDDLVCTDDGRRIPHLDLVFKGEPFVREGQIVQETLNRIRVKVVPFDGFNSKNAHDITTRLKQRVGGRMEIVLETVDHLPRTAAGKFRPIISLIKPANGGYIGVDGFGDEARETPALSGRS